MVKNLYEMTKEELIAKCKRLESENENLQDELDRLSDAYDALECENADLSYMLDDENVIKDVDWFKFRLELEGLLTQQLDDFIEKYLIFHNEKRKY